MFKYFFYAYMASLGFSFLMGLIAVWFEDVWKNDVSWKLMYTAWATFAVTLAGAIITKWLAPL